MAYKRLGDMLLEEGIISAEQLQEALKIQKEQHERLGTVLINEGFITEKDLIDALQMQLGIEFIYLSQANIDPALSQVVSKNIAQKFEVVPVKVVQDKLYLAMKDPMNFMAIEEIKSITRKRVIPMIATRNGVDRAIMDLYGNEGAARAIKEMQRDVEGVGLGSAVTYAAEISDEDEVSAPAIRLVNSIIERAATENASDIHIECREAEVMVRMRIDGVMRNILSTPKSLQQAIISRVKIMSGMDIAEKRIPQDGRAAVRVHKKEYDLRISTLPTIYGEKIVIRLLDKSSGILSAKGIGLSGDDYLKYSKIIRNSNGVVLIVGPTGSGKSSTMYTMIKELNTDEVNLITLEDPVEYNVAGVNQVQINEKVDMTFASGLRAILRQDPDIIAVGEIRDGETAEIAMRAALTGHLVLSTVHTNDALSTIDRLIDIGVEPYMVGTALTGVVSQRLVRKICPNCKISYKPDEEELAMMDLPADTEELYMGKGCPLCFETGYRGRTAVFEILVMNKELRKAVTEGTTRSELKEILDKSDFVSLKDNCKRLVLEGTTTIDEARRIINTVE